MKPVRLKEIVHFFCENQIVKNSHFSDDFKISSFAGLENATPQSISFFSGATQIKSTNAKSYSNEIFANLECGVLLVPEDFEILLPQVACLIKVKNPYEMMIRFLNHFVLNCENFEPPFIAPSAKIHPTAIVEGSVGEYAEIGPYTVVMQGAHIGAYSKLDAHVVVYPHVKMATHCIIQAGVVIGSQGFGFFQNEKGDRLQVPHLAGVIIEDYVSIGANSNVAAGFVSPTYIGPNSHLDALVQIGHNCRIGAHCFFASQVALGGSTVIEDNVEFAGAAKTAGHLKVGQNAKVAAKAGVTKDVPANTIVAGFPAEEISKWRHSIAVLRRLSKR